MLRSLPDKTRRQVCRKAARDALLPLMREMRAAAPRLTGALRKAIRIWFSLRKSGEARSGIRVKDTPGMAGKERLPPSVYAWWVEAGHGWGKASSAVRRWQRSRRRAGNVAQGDTRRRTRAWDFMGGVWRAAEARTLRTYMDALRTGVTAAWDRGV